MWEAMRCILPYCYIIRGTIRVLQMHGVHNVPTNGLAFVSSERQFYPRPPSSDSRRAIEKLLHSMSCFLWIFLSLLPKTCKLSNCTFNIFKHLKHQTPGNNRLLKHEYEVLKNKRYWWWAGSVWFSAILMIRRSADFHNHDVCLAVRLFIYYFLFSCFFIWNSIAYCGGSKQTVVFRPWPAPVAFSNK